MIAQRQRDIFPDGEVVEQLPVLEYHAKSQPLIQAGIFNDRHWFTKEPVGTSHRGHQSGSSHEEVALTRALQAGHYPIIPCFYGPVDILDDNRARIPHRANCHVSHVDSGHVGGWWSVI